MCGTYNDDQSDDNKCPDGKPDAAWLPGKHVSGNNLGDCWRY